MKTAFERNDYKFEPQPIIYFNGRLTRPWHVFFKHKGALGNYFWVRLGTRFYSPRTPKRDII